MGKLDTVTVNGPEGDVLDWDAVEWRQVEDDVRRLRQRIFTATQAGDLKRVRNLQKLLLRSRANALLSVRRVTSTSASLTWTAFRACLSPVRPTAHAGF
ncbi:MAG TPA: reverse transcriptase N-terminal domain-containing protein [Actinomycetes bacterium]|nr:reverse transcriptase N-terminal domain-containing protein [Actinomycetes bacterium]